MDLTDYIVPTEIKSYDEKTSITSTTKDLVYILSSNDITKYCLDPSAKFFDIFRKTPTDYAVFYGDLKKMRSQYWTRSNDKIVDELGLFQTNNFPELDDSHICTCPCIHLGFPKSPEEQKVFLSELNLKKEKDFYTVELGEFPQTKLWDLLQETINKIFLDKNGSSMKGTGKTYTGSISKDRYNFYTSREYIEQQHTFTKDKLVLVVKNDNLKENLRKQEELMDCNWFTVDPIVWDILNWDNLPVFINPHGNGTAEFLVLQTQKAIIVGIPFYPHPSEKYSNLWVNSTIRAYLNGLDLNYVKKFNVIKEFGTLNAGDFSTRSNFLSEAFSKNFQTSSQDKIDIENPINIQEPAPKDEEKEKTEPSILTQRHTRLENLNPDKTPEEQRFNFTDTEIIKSWIDAGQSVLLRGPSGIGKTERIKRLYPDLIYIKLTNNMFPEKVVGSVNLQTGQNIPPDFAKQTLLKCATDEERKLVENNIQNIYSIAETIYNRSKQSDKKIVILLDELLNVKPAIQSLVYTLVLNKLVESGNGVKLPANTVIVATGNQKKYSQAAEDLAEPLEKRFDHILDMEPKVNEWIFEYAIPNKVHASVISYIFSKYQQNLKEPGKKGKINYFYEEPEVGESQTDENGCRGKTNDPRGWVSVSNMLKNFETELSKGTFVGKNVEQLLITSLSSKLRDVWASDFFEFYNKPTLTVTDVITKNYSIEDLPKTIDEKFATIAGLLSADENEVVICRNFIHKFCSAEYLSLFDIYWAGNNEKRMQQLVEMKAKTQQNLELEAVSQ
jgi:hypothetical protein